MHANKSLDTTLPPFHKSRNTAITHRATALDRVADLELSLGHHDTAERLAHAAADLRQERAP